MEILSRLSERVGAEVNRRQLLKLLAGSSVGVMSAAMLPQSVLGGIARIQQGAVGRRADLPRYDRRRGAARSLLPALRLLASRMPVRRL